MFDVNQVYKCDCIDLDFEGNGVCKIDDFPFFVKGPLKGERVEIRVDKVNKNYGFATLLKKFTTSPFRAIPKCPYYETCGGCNIMHLNYEMQADYKRHIVKDTISRIGKIDCRVNEVVTMPNPYNYRNNVQYVFGYNKKIVAGFYERKTHNVIDMDRCLIAPAIAERIITFLKTLFKTYGVSIYNDTNDTGCIRHVIVRTNNKCEIMLVFVTRTPYLEKEKEIIEEVVNKFTKVTSIIHNVNPDNTSVIMGSNSKVIYGVSYLIDTLFDMKYEISANSFYQVNSEQVVHLYNKVFEYANLRKTDVVIDAYCGIGTMALLAAKLASKVYGIEVVDEAIKNANRNKEINGIENVDFILGLAEEKIQEIVSKEKIDCLIVDPPRKGCEEAFLQSIVGIKRIVYVSCNVRTLARDLKFLVEQGYEVKEVTPVDMFPHTSHIECVSLITLKR